VCDISIPIGHLLLNYCYIQLSTKKKNIYIYLDFYFEGSSSSESPEGGAWEVQDLLKASVVAGVDVVSGLLAHLLDAAKAPASRLPALVPPGLYLPAPPLYCPQPTPNTQVSSEHQPPPVWM